MTDGARTRNLLDHNQTLYQLSYSQHSFQLFSLFVRYSSNSRFVSRLSRLRPTLFLIFRSSFFMPSVPQGSGFSRLNSSFIDVSPIKKPAQAFQPGRVSLFRGIRLRLIALSRFYRSGRVTGITFPCMIDTAGLHPTRGGNRLPFGFSRHCKHRFFALVLGSFFVSSVGPNFLSQLAKLAWRSGPVTG